MNATYDPIAPAYRKCKQQPWRTHIECYTMAQLIGDVAGQTVLDLACGEGYYTRLLARLGAGDVTGVDISANMIRLAQREEGRAPLGIEYLVHDAATLELGRRFDLIVGSYLLCHARTADELLAMCSAVARCLRPGGRFIAVTNNAAQAPEHFPTMRKYGFVKRQAGAGEGAPLTVEFLLGDSSFTLTNYTFSRRTYAWALHTAGLYDLRWHWPRLSAEAAAPGSHYWDAFLEHPPILFLECSK
jgi:SAM-dependent methyltransferase